MTTTDQTTDQPTTEPPTGWPPATVALDLARQMVAEWRAIGRSASQAERDDPGFGRLRAEIAGAGRQQMDAARLAAYFAQVSIAEDLHAMRRVMLGDELGGDAERGGDGPTGTAAAQ